MTPTELTLEQRIINQNGSRIEQGRGADGTPELRIMDEIERGLAGRVRAGKGPLSSALSSSFNISRQWGGRS